MRIAVGPFTGGLRATGRDLSVVHSLLLWRPLFLRRRLLRLVPLPRSIPFRLLLLLLVAPLPALLGVVSFFFRLGTFLPPFSLTFVLYLTRLPFAYARSPLPAAIPLSRPDPLLVYS